MTIVLWQGSDLFSASFSNNDTSVQLLRVISHLDELKARTTRQVINRREIIKIEKSRRSVLTLKGVAPEQMFVKSFGSQDGSLIGNSDTSLSRPREILRISLCVTEYTEVAQCWAPPNKKRDGTSLNLTAHINSRQRVSFRRYKSGTASKGVSPDVRSRCLRFSEPI